MALPLVTPMSSQRVQQNWGICDHPDFSGGYTNRAAVIDRIAGMRISYIRGMFTHDSRGDDTCTQLSANNMGWVMTVFPTEHGMTTENWSPGFATSENMPLTCVAPSRDPTSGTTPARAAYP